MLPAVPPQFRATSSVTQKLGTLCVATYFTLMPQALFHLPLHDSPYDSSFQSPTRYIVSLGPAESIEESTLTEQITAKLPPNVRWIRRMSGNAWVLESQASAQETSNALARLKAQGVIQHFESDSWVSVSQSSTGRTDSLAPALLAPLADEPSNPDDPMFHQQWQLHDDITHAASIDAVGAWQITHGSQDTVIAVIDTGVRPDHPDLTGRLLPGYDFVSGFHDATSGHINHQVPLDLVFARSNDGDGRDPDPTDPGDGASAELAEQLTALNIPCASSSSTWHGTGVASLIAANANDGVGLAGIDWQASILPVRAIGRCGGHRSDLLDAIRWAAGVQDPALPDNPHPAHIINLSLGMNDTCSAMDQAAINDAVSAGAIVVSAVGNQGRNTRDYPSSPAQCHNVLGVAATDEAGYLAGYSNYGQDADIAAPGGTRFPSAFGVDVATHSGAIDDIGINTWKTVSGTSVAAPLVSGTLALMRSVQPGLSAQQLTELLLTSAAPFPHDWEVRFAAPCDTTTCGAGMLNTHHAVRTAVAYEVPATRDQTEAFNDSVGSEPELAGSLNDDVSGIANTPLGCTVVPAHAHQVGKDPLLLMLLSAAIVGLRRKALATASRFDRVVRFSNVLRLIGRHTNHLFR